MCTRTLNRSNASLQIATQLSSPKATWFNTELFHEEPKYRCDECHLRWHTKYCLQAHMEAYHTAEGAQKRRKKENNIAKCLDENGIEYEREFYVNFRCVGPDHEGSNCRVDFKINKTDTDGNILEYVFLEVDEHQHVDYPTICETRRMTECHLNQVTGGNVLPIVFLRYNPDSYTIDDIKGRTRSYKRQERLVEALNCMAMDKPLGIYYMYYDTVDGLPRIFADEEYEDYIKSCLIDCVA